MEAILRNLVYVLEWIWNECNLYIGKDYLGSPMYTVCIVSCSNIPNTDRIFFVTVFVIHLLKYS